MSYVASSVQPTLQNVIETDTCIACGACIEACPKKIIEPAYNDFRGAHEITVNARHECIGCDGVCEKVCPSISFDYVPFEGTHELERLGRLEAVYVGHSNKFQFNGNSSSGGVVRELIHHYVNHNVPVICLAGVDGSYKAQRIVTHEDLETVPSSIYHGVSFVDAIKLLQAAEEKCVLVAIPCVLEGIQKYISTVEPHLSKKIEITVGIICGWMYSDHSWQSFSRFKSIQENVVDVAYRGEEKVGLLKLKTPNKVYKYPRRGFASFRDEIDFRTSYSGVFNRFRCRMCQNHTNITADIAVGDAWLQRFSAAHEKLSILITRTGLGENLIETLAKSGGLILDRSTPEDIVESQSLNLVNGITAQTVAIFQQGRNQPVPNFHFSNSRSHSLSFREALKCREELFWRAVVRLRYYSVYRFRIMLRHLPRELKRLFKGVVLQ